MKAFKISLLLFLAVSLTSVSCKKESNESNDSGISEYNENDNNETKVSTYNSMQSHNSGQNCVTCHKSGGTGESIFKVAGTVYDSTLANVFPNSTVKLYTQPMGGGTLKYTIQVDGKGNFYSTNTIDFSTPLYPAVEGNSTTKYMGSSISTGACYSCHNNSTGKVWTK